MLFALQRSDQGTKHLSEAIALRECGVTFRRRQQTDALSKMNMCLKFFQRTLGYAQKLNEGLSLLSSVALGDVRWD